MTFQTTSMCEREGPVVTVCIPVFNGAAFIGECVRSVLSQNFEDFELLIVDNGSTDNSIKICMAFQDPRIRIHRSNVNVGAFRNFRKCFDLARGELVMLLPCDDILEPGCLSVLARPLIEDPEMGLAFGGARAIDSSGIILTEPKFASSGRLTSEQTLTFVIDYFNPIQHPMVRKASYFRAGRFRKKFGCFLDIPVWTKIIHSSPSIYLAESVTSSVRMHPAQGQNIMNNMSADNLTNVADHFGVRSLKQHQYRNSYNLCFLRFVKSFQNLDPRQTAPTKNVLHILSKLIHSNIHALASALLRRDSIRVGLELVVLRRIGKQFSKSIVCRIYLQEAWALMARVPRNLNKFRRIASGRAGTLDNVKSSAE